MVALDAGSSRRWAAGRRSPYLQLPMLFAAGAFLLIGLPQDKALAVPERAASQYEATAAAAPHAVKDRLSAFSDRVWRRLTGWAHEAQRESTAAVSDLRQSLDESREKLGPRWAETQTRLHAFSHTLMTSLTQAQHMAADTLDRIARWMHGSNGQNSAPNDNNRVHV